MFRTMIDTYSWSFNVFINVIGQLGDCFFKCVMYAYYYYVIKIP